jgi:cysteine-rich repeat protein
MMLKRCSLVLLAVVGCSDGQFDTPPVLATQQISVTVAEDGVVMIDATAGDPEGYRVTYSTTQPTHGVLTGDGPMYTYTPAKDYTGTDEVIVSVSDGRNHLTFPVRITVTAVDDAPSASDLSATTSENQGVMVSFTATDIDSAVLSYSVVVPPAHGTVTGVPPNVTYTPSLHYFGADSFTYKAFDGVLDSNVATVTLAISNVITCGDGVVEGTEQCDDGNQSNTDGCLNNCMSATCGDGIIEAEVEQCDDANASNTDACLTTCKVATCGDSFTQDGVEECDDGNASNADGCLNTCKTATCGDGFTRDGVEACDDGNQDDSDGCLSTCTVASCGDGIVQDGVEACDDGNQDNTDGCLSTCVVASCGDGFTQTGVEECDDGNADDTDACLHTCKAATCGDGATQAGVEQCDDANLDNTDACLTTCKLASCGDGFTQTGVEQCDDGNADNTDACLTTCKAATCGDSFVEAGVEECDDANADNTDACLDSCKTARCGDGFAQTGVELCDDGNTSNTDACLNDCTVAVCGDGFVEAGFEQCDDGNTNDNDECHNDCTRAVCGNGIVEAGEECDDGNTADGDNCGHSCKVERCGDGLVQFRLGEECDDGNTEAGDGCTATCKTFPWVTTLPVNISHELSCTTSVANAARKIAVDGSGTVYVVMQCGVDGDVAVSHDRGQTFTAPFNLSVDLGTPQNPATVSQIAVNNGPSGVAYVAIMLNSGQVFLRVTEDGGGTWGTASSVGLAVDPSSGLSLQSFNDEVFIGFSTSGGVAVVRNHHRGSGTFDTTGVGMSIQFFDLLYDVVLSTLVVAADTPDFHLRASDDIGVSFASEVNPPGQEFYSDWAIGNGRIYVSGTNLDTDGDSDSTYVIRTSGLTTSNRVFGLPVMSTAQSRTVAADAAGNGFFASQLDGGGIQLDRLAVDATTFDAPRLLDPAGNSPIVGPLPGNQGAAVVYTVGTSVFATVQTYPQPGAHCATNPKWQPVDCSTDQWVWSSDRSFGSVDEANTARTLETGCQHADIPNTCSLDGNGWVSTQVFTMAGCNTSWFHLVLGGNFNCGGHDGDQYRHLSKDDESCYDY